MNNIPIDELFEPRILYPNSDMMNRLSKLLGLDNHISRLSKMLGILVNPTGLISWFKEYYPDSDEILDLFNARAPLVILEGDVGAGKTELAITIGDKVSRQEDIEITLFPLSLSSRGQGRVGEMTQLISASFKTIFDEASKLKSRSGRHRGAIILLIDEADAIAQSREFAQMHHEDRAGVNTLIRGIDRLTHSNLPAAVILCTNRTNALDPAIKRRAADILTFSRPGIELRRKVLQQRLEKLKFGSLEIEEIAEQTGKRDGRDYGFSYSDLIQRLIPAIILDAYPNQSIDTQRAIEITKSMIPSPPFKEVHYE